MKPRRAALAALVFLSACSARTRRFIGYQFAGPAPAASCRAEGPARVCVYAPEGGENRDVVYFFHYATGDERSWNRLGLSRAFYAEYRRRGRPAPRVVTVSYGPYWLLTDAPGLRQTVTLKDFNALRARVERGLAPVARRYLWGMSQGGYDAAVAALSAPRDWAAVALSCPALEASTPYKKPQREPTARSAEGRQLFTYRLSGDAAWRAGNPLALVAAARHPPPFWIEANADDEFGYLSGARALAEALRGAGDAAVLVVSPGGHCAIDARAAARFLAMREDGDGAAARSSAAAGPR